MNNKTLRYTALVACLLSPMVWAQGQGAGAPPMPPAPKAGPPVMEHGTSGRDTAQRAAEQGDADRDTRIGFGAEQSAEAQAQQDATSQDAHLEAKGKTEAQAEVTTSNDASEAMDSQSTSGQGTAARARTQQNADLETRKSMGDTQSQDAKERAKERKAAKDDDGDDGQ